MALPLLPQQHVLAKDFLQDDKAHVRQTVAPPIKVFTRRLIQVLVSNISRMLTQSGLSCQLAGPNVLHHTFSASDAVNYSGSLAIQFSFDLNNCIRGSGLHQPCFQYKKTYRTASQVLHAFVHSIPHSLFSDWDWPWYSCSDQKGSQVSTDLVGSKRGRREYLSEIWICVDHCSPVLCHNITD